MVDQLVEIRIAQVDRLELVTSEMHMSTPELGSDRRDRRPLRFILITMLEHEPNRPLPHLRRIPV